MSERVLTVGEVAAQLRVSPKTVRRWIAAGKFQRVSMVTRRSGWRIPESEVRCLLRRTERGG